MKHISDELKPEKLISENLEELHREWEKERLNRQILNEKYIRERFENVPNDPFHSHACKFCGNSDECFTDDECYLPKLFICPECAYQNPEIEYLP